MLIAAKKTLNSVLTDRIKTLDVKNRGQKYFRI